MKQLLTILLILLYVSISFADDAVIVKQSSHANSWESRLEADSHNVTVGTSLPSNISSYEMLIDFRYTTAISSSDETKMETVLANDGTVVLIGENSNSSFRARNNSIQALLRQWTGDNTITYSTTQYIGYSGDDEQLSDTNVLSSLPGNWAYLNFAAGGVITDLGDDGEYIAKNSDGQIGVAMWRGTALTANYQGGVVIVITDVNHASGSYYTDDNAEFIDALIDDLLQQNATNRATGVSITSAQTTTRTAALNADRENGCNVCITQSGANFTANIRQDGNANFIVDKDWSGPALITGDNVTLTVRQGNVTTSGSSDENGLGLYINGNNTNLTVLQGDHANDQGEHKAVVDLNGNSNVVNLEQYDSGTLSKHFAFIDVDALSNSIDISQRDNGQKTLFLDVNNNSNDIDILQKDTGTHYLDVTVEGAGTHDIDIMQQGSGNHAARVSLSGYTVDFDLNQQGSTAQSYANTYNCTNALGCTVAVTQGN